MERASRLLVLSSTLAALAAYGWLVGWIPGLRLAAAGVFVLGFALSRLSMPLGFAAPLLAAYVAPALLMVAFGTTDYNTTLVWLAALAGPIYARSNGSRWHLPREWAWPVITWALVLSVTWPIVAGREVDFSLVAARTFDTTTGLLFGPPPASAAWVIGVALGQLLALLWFDLLWARFGAERLKRAERVVLIPLLGSALLAALAGLYQGHVDLTWVNPGIWSRLGRAGGLMLDANSFGMACAIWAPLALALLTALGRPAAVAWAAYLLLAAALWTSGSRTALVTLGVGTVGVLVGYLQRRGTWQPRLVPIGLLVGSAVLLLVLVLAPRGGNSSSPLQRVFDRLPTPDGPSLSAFADEMWSRFGYGEAAARAVREHPASGVGIGGFHALSTDYSYLEKGVMNRPDNAQNWWRHQLAELGLVGALPAFWASLMVALLVWRGGARGEHREPASVVRGVVVGVGLASLLGVPTQHPAMTLTLVTAIFWLAALAVAPDRAPRRSPSGIGWTAAVVVVLITVAGQVQSAHGDLRLPARAQRAGFPFAYGLSAPEPSAEYGELRWTAGHAVFVGPAPTRWLELTIWALHPDVASNPVTATIWRDGAEVSEITFTSQAPVRRVLHVTDGETAAWFEVGASRTFGRGRGLRLATRWLNDAPADAPEGEVVR